MSQENVDRARRGLDAFTRRDKVTWFELMDPEIEFVPVGEWPEADPTRGAEAVWEFNVAVDEPWEGGAWEAGEVVDGDDKVVLRVRRDMRGKSSGVEVEFDYWAVLSFRDRKCARMEWFADRDTALEAAGLSE